jgi:hypothetical protein
MRSYEYNYDNGICDSFDINIMPGMNGGICVDMEGNFLGVIVGPYQPSSRKLKRLHIATHIGNTQVKNLIQRYFSKIIVRKSNLNKNELENSYWYTIDIDMNTIH